MFRQAMFRLLLASLLATLTNAYAAEPPAETPAESAKSGVEEFYAACKAWDADGFSKAAELFGKAAKQEPRSAVYKYWEGVSHFHRMLKIESRPGGKESPKAKSAMEAALAAFEGALDLDADHAESHALVATIFGMKIHSNMLNAVRYGPMLQHHQKEAVRLGAKNPRVKYLVGVGLLHTAKDDEAKRKALDTLLAAEKLFAEEVTHSADPLTPRWGSASCRTFIGVAYKMLGRNAEAIDYFNRALAEHPSDHIARQELAAITSKEEAKP
ncbi:MAG: tetratricopeptide repeat protein [Verrucomicrobia bacterium]|nr:tetratricopeptide repeat protein [Verrucomicrobiota bacterium]